MYFGRGISGEFDLENAMNDIFFEEEFDSEFTCNLRKTFYDIGSVGECSVYIKSRHVVRLYQTDKRHRLRSLLLFH